MSNKNRPNILKPKNTSEFRKAVNDLARQGYVALPVRKDVPAAKTSEWEKMVMSVGGSDGAGKNGSYVAAVSQESEDAKNFGTEGLGWMSWGADNKLPNNIAALTGMLPYTATGWKFNTDVTTGLGPKPKYRYTQYTPGIGISTKEIDYDAAGPMIRQRMLDLRKEYLRIKKDNQQEDDVVTDMLNGIKKDNQQEDDVVTDMLNGIKKDIKALEEEYHIWEKTSGELKSFAENTDLNLLMLKMSSEYHLTGMCFPEIQLSSDLTTPTKIWKPRVTGLGFYSCWITRMERRDAENKINYVYLSNKWLEGEQAEEKDISVLPAINPDCPAKDLKEQILNIRTEDKKKPEDRPTRFVLPVAYPSPGKAYYTQPSWHSIFCGNIYEYASTIISDRATRRKNSNIIGRVIYVHSDYLEKLYVQQGCNSPEERAALFDEIVEEINTFLRDPDNSGQSLFAFTFTGPDNKEHESYRIVEIPASNKGTAEANKTELEEVCNILFFAQHIHPDLIGAIPGHSGSSGGTYQREMLLIKQLLLSPTRNLLLKPFEVASIINDWDPHLVWRIQQMALTTLDNSKTGMKEAETE